MGFKTEFTITIILGSCIIFTLLLLVVILVNRHKRKILKEKEEFQKTLKEREAALESKLREEIHKRKSAIPEIFTVTTKGRKIHLNTSNILFVKSEGNYIEIHCKTQRVIVREKISNFFNVIPDPDQYIRIHRSFIGRIDNIQHVGKRVVKIGDTELKIGDKYREALEGLEV